ncbi:MAG: class I SAM-dependent methyltransferase [Desulfobacterales bacterium]|nr:class I SAM-dependent methyltransferase [Desulfobacterales bacterium]
MTAVNNKTEIKAYGLRLLLSRHPEIAKLKRKHAPSVHGNKSWSTSWVLIDHIRKTRLIPGAKILEIGCGWGMTGIFCAKKFDAAVTAADIDPDIHPFLDLHARINKVKVAFLNKGFDQISSSRLRDVDLIIGSDICFWDDLIDPLRRLIQRARRASVGRILIADPGRPTFDSLVASLSPKKGVEVLDHEIKKPRRMSGKILHITHHP